MAKKVKKKQQSYYLDESAVLAVSKMAQTLNRSLSATATIMLKNAYESMAGERTERLANGEGE